MKIIKIIVLLALLIMPAQVSADIKIEASDERPTCDEARLTLEVAKVRLVQLEQMLNSPKATVAWKNVIAMEYLAIMKMIKNIQQWQIGECPTA